MTMKPLADRVLIKVEKEEEKTVGGLVLATKNPAGVPARSLHAAKASSPRTAHAFPWKSRLAIPF